MALQHNLVLVPIKYEVKGTVFFISFRGDNSWAVESDIFTLNKNNELEYEPQPSSRNEVYLKNNRYNSPEEGLNQLWEYFSKKLG